MNSISKMKNRFENKGEMGIRKNTTACITMTTTKYSDKLFVFGVGGTRPIPSPI